MQNSYTAQEWRTLFKRCKTRTEREALMGLPINLAAKLLGIGRSRIHQLLKEEKLDSVSVRDEKTGVRIAHMVTLATLDQRRMIKRKAGQWRPGG